jgi:hypothetical protein
LQRRRPLYSKQCFAKHLHFALFNIPPKPFRLVVVIHNQFDDLFEHVLFDDVAGVVDVGLEQDVHLVD